MIDFSENDMRLIIVNYCGTQQISQKICKERVKGMK